MKRFYLKVGVFNLFIRTQHSDGNGDVRTTLYNSLFLTQFSETDTNNWIALISCLYVLNVFLIKPYICMKYKQKL